jgi:putative restriction endonuclease
MRFDPAALDIGRLYSRTELAPMWGYRKHNAIGKGVVTRADVRYIVLFVTREKQESLTQYVDFLNGDMLHWEGEKGHRYDKRIARAHERGDEIHLFYRDIHHTPFRYHGQILLTHFVERVTKPSKFTFRLVHDLGPMDDIESHAAELAEVSTTQRLRLVQARLGQGRFREDLFKYWEGCAITGIDRADLLRASHIKPWRSSSNAERLSSHNGLLLLPQYDHLFDRGYITFDEQGQLRPSPAIVALPPQRLGVELAARLRRVAAEHLPFLEYHYKSVFLKRIESD